MGTNAEAFHNSRLLVGYSVRLDQMADRNGHIFPHAAILVNADHAHLRAAVRFPVPASDTGSTVNVRNYADWISNYKTVFIPANLRDLRRQFMAQYPRINKIGLIAFIGVKIGTADADLPPVRGRGQGPPSFQIGSVPRIRYISFHKHSFVILGSSAQPG